MVAGLWLCFYRHVHTTPKLGSHLTAGKNTITISAVAENTHLPLKWLKPQ